MAHMFPTRLLYPFATSLWYTPRRERSFQAELQIQLLADKQPTSCRYLLLSVRVDNIYIIKNRSLQTVK